jgi:hypothetical protein
MSLEILVSEYEAYKKKENEMSKGLRKNFHPLFVRLFEKHPWVESFSWRQCEPWRDGDETEFEVLCDAEQIRINDIDSYDDEVYGKEEKQKAYADFSEVLGDVPIEIMKVMFGDSNGVEVRKNGDVNVTEYEDG